MLHHSKPPRDPRYLVVDNLVEEFGFHNIDGKEKGSRREVMAKIQSRMYELQVESRIRRRDRSNIVHEGAQRTADIASLAFLLGLAVFFLNMERSDSPNAILGVADDLAVAGAMSVSYLVRRVESRRERQKPTTNFSHEIAKDPTKGLPRDVYDMGRDHRPGIDQGRSGSSRR